MTPQGQPSWSDVGEAAGRVAYNPIHYLTRAAAVPGRVMAQVTGTLFGGTRMLFTRTQGAWSILLSRTRIDYRREVGDPMANSAVAAVTGWIARNFPEAPVVVKRVREGQDDELVAPGPTGAGYMLRLLERPNPYYSGVLQWMATILDYLSGNAYWIKVRSDSDRPVQLWWVPAANMEPRWPEGRSDVFIGWYEYTIEGEIYRLRPRDVVHFRQGIDPRNARKGLSRFGALIREIFTDEEASAFTASLLRNLGVPGVIIAPANTTSGPVRTDPEQVKKTFMERFGGDGRGEPMVLTSPTEVKVLSWSPEQMNLRELRRVPEERVSAVLGVPAIVAGLGAGLDRSTFNNVGEAKVSAYTEGVVTLQRLIAAELEVQLLVDFVDLDAGWDVAFDWSKAAAMQAFADMVWNRNLAAFKGGAITRAAFKKATGQLVLPGDEVYKIAINYELMTPGDAAPSPVLLPGGRQARVPVRVAA